MARKKEDRVAGGDTEKSEQVPRRSCNITSGPAQQLPIQSVPLISRNKHWRYISSYHGSWLSLPTEILSTLAHNNYYSPNPRPIDPAVFFDLVKIRCLIDDASNLSVRAANGTTAASFTNSLNSSNGYLNRADTEILGIGYARAGAGNAKLSRERKFRMREHATSKLSHAYRLDEIAATVATMQSASALEEVAKHVLARNEQDPDAQYVHFFHEKIPSRAVAENTPLEPLTDIINQRPTEASAYRTRAISKIFRDDFTGSATDLTEALAVHRLYSDHRMERKEIILAKDVGKLQPSKLEEKDHPSSMKPQLLFHRAGVYLNLACQNIAAALERSDDETQNLHVCDNRSTQNTQDKEDTTSRFEARKSVRTYAKRAVRDYTAFLCHFDYTPGVSPEYKSALVQKIASGHNVSSGSSRNEKSLDIEVDLQNTSSAAIPKYEQHDRKNQSDDSHIPRMPIYKVSELFNATPPHGLPPYPSTAQQAEKQAQAVFDLPGFSEAVTYHPLIVDVLHSLLLCHCLVQTSVKELQRHAYMAARVVRICDGFPIFLAARSPSRADWNEVLRSTRNWLGLEQTWEQLCTLSTEFDRRHGQSASYQDGYLSRKSKGAIIRTQDIRSKWKGPEDMKSGVMRGAHADDKVIDEVTARTQVRVQEAIHAIAFEEEEMRKEYHNVNLPCHRRTNGAKSITKNQAENLSKSNSRVNDKDKGVQSVTARAEMIARWILEAPSPGASNPSSASRKKSSKKSSKKRAAKGQLHTQTSETNVLNGLSNASSASSPATKGLDKSIENLDMFG